MDCCSAVKRGAEKGKAVTILVLCAVQCETVFFLVVATHKRLVVSWMFILVTRTHLVGIITFISIVKRDGFQ